MTAPPPTASPATSPPAGAPKFALFAALTGVTSLGIIVQAVLAGAFIDRANESSLINAHQGIAYAVVVVSLATLLVAQWTLRRAAPPLYWGSLLLFVLLVVQTIIGHIITSSGNNDLLVVHVPLALIVFGLTIWLSITAAQTRRAAERAAA